MGKRVRIDFVIREECDDPAQARGISFGEDVPVEDIHDFIDRCRDAAKILFNGKRPPPELPAKTAAETMRELDAEYKRIKAESYGKMYRYELEAASPSSAHDAVTEYESAERRAREEYLRRMPR